MLRPVKLFRVTIQIPEKHMSNVLGILGDFKLLHLININETQLGRLGYIANIEEELVERYDRALRRITGLVHELGISGPVPSLPAAPRPDREIFEIEERLSEIENEVSGAIEDARNSEKELAKKRELVSRLSLLLPSDIDFDRLSALGFVHASFGILPAENLDRLEESLSDIHHTLVKISSDKKRMVIAAFCLKEKSEVLDRALKSAFFQAIEIPTDITGPVTRVVEGLQKEIPLLEEKRVQAMREKEKFSRKFASELLLMREKALVAKILLQAEAKFGKIDHTYLLTGWLPVHLYEKLRESILRATDGEAVIERVDPEDIREVRAGIIKIPILFNNPMLIRPFERLTSLYGTPSYQEVEPTLFLALSFVLLFGMMFGDVGHGLVLFLAGLYIFRRLYRYMDYGIILMECGVSSAIFGLLYGSVFGMEDIIPALWLHPMKDIDHFMMVAAGVGMAMISLGLIINLVNIVKRRKFRELLTAGGLVGALLYWLLAGLAIRYVLSGVPTPEEIMAAKVISGVLLLIMIVERPITVLLKRKRAEADGTKRGIKSSIATLVLESTIEALDSVLRFLANTVSFVRVAAFALTHAALFIGVFSIADMVSHGTGTGISYYLTLITGNIVIILLEGMVVSIQTIRLEYYEFFSKFFRGGGEPFRPLVEENR